MPQLGRMHQFKFKSDGLAQVPLGIYTYPVLQAADILLFRATHVPVGEDQVQHLEFCRDLAAKFNNQFNTDFFPLPVTIEGTNPSTTSFITMMMILVVVVVVVFVADLTKLRSLREPTKKMSKSDTDPLSRIELVDEPHAIERKLRKAVTDCESMVTYEPERRPGVATLVEIEAACRGDRDPDECAEEASLLRGEDTGEYKKHVARLLVEHLAPIRARYRELIDDRVYLRRVLDEGASRACHIAELNYQHVRRIVGMS